MALARVLVLGIAVLLIHSAAASAQPQRAVPAPRSNRDAYAPSPGPQPERELQPFVPDGFGGLKEDPPMSSEIPNAGAPNMPTVDPTAPDR